MGRGGPPALPERQVSVPEAWLDYRRPMARCFSTECQDGLRRPAKDNEKPDVRGTICCRNRAATARKRLLGNERFSATGC